MTLATPEVLEKLAADPERFPGALLLTGPSEARLEEESRRIAARLLCPGNDPAAECGSCRRVLAGIHPDFFSVEPEGVQIKVDRIREALAFGAGRPYESARRVARILRAGDLGIEGANALLKSLEEPGERFRWILATSRPELLLATIRSRCTAAAIPALGPEERAKAWIGRGFSEEDARDLVLFAGEAGEPELATRLSEGRAQRQAIVSALEEGLLADRPAALLVLGEAVASLAKGEAGILAEILADAALAFEAPQSQAIRHRSVAGKLAEIARRTGPEALRDAALEAADPPADNRKGNRRLHYERALLGLWERRTPS
jgi:hypothetical protein